MTYGEQLKARLARKGWTYPHLAARTHLSRSTIQKIISQGREPRYATKVLIEKAMGRG